MKNKSLYKEKVFMSYGYNFFFWLCSSVMIIVASYTGMFYSIQMTRASTPLAIGDREFAFRFFFIVFTDCCCWTPIIVLKILALINVAIPGNCLSSSISALTNHATNMLRTSLVSRKTAISLNEYFFNIVFLFDLIPRSN